jgi:flagellar basal body P-ring protein FlgI
MKRPQIAVLLWSTAALLCGCTVWDLHGSGAKKAVESLPPQPQLVGDLAVPFGLYPVSLEAVSLVVGLPGTGSDPEPSPQRAMLLDEMHRRGVKDCNELLASRNVALVLVRGVLPPGIQKGDRFDVELHVPNRSETASLRGGTLLETPLCDMAMIPDVNRLFNGKIRGVAQGPVLVDPSATEKSDRVLLGRGRVLGGGVARESRSLGLLLKCGDETQMTTEQLRDATVTSARVANAINRRYHTYQKGVKVGAATAKTGKYIDLAVDPRYKDNIDRYMQVVRAIALEESAAETNQRIAGLEGQLANPASAARGALQLEAIGTLAVPALLKGIKCPEREVRFCSAEALAYLDRAEAAEPLAEVARQEPAFRALALAALAAMDEMAASDQLRQLLEVPSVETRYGAFRALWTLNPKDPLVQGERLGGQFSYHVLDVKGPPLVHVTRNRRAEVVLFGRDQRFLTPLASINAGPRIMVTSTGPDQLSVSRFAPNEPDQKRIVSTRMDDVIRAIVAVGGTYPDVVQAFQEAKAGGALQGRFEVDAVPEGGRVYDRPAQAEQHADAEKARAVPPPGKDPSNDGDQGGWQTAGTPAPADKTSVK